MPIKTNTTNITGAFAKLNLLLKIRNVLALSSETIIGLSLIEAIDKKYPADEILKTIQDCEMDNPVLITKIIGDDLMQQVLDIKIS